MHRMEISAYVLHALLEYKVFKNKVGFPVESLGKVISMLEKNCIDYIVISVQSEMPLKRKFPNNNYEKIVCIGKERCDKEVSNESLMREIMKLDDEKVNLIYDFIKDVVYSG